MYYQSTRGTQQIFAGRIAALGRLWNLATQCKNPAFSEEEEWRLVKVPIEDNGDKTLWKHNDCMISPYIEFNFSDDDKQRIRKVYLGPKNQAANQGEAKRAIRQYLEKMNLMLMR